MSSSSEVLLASLCRLDAPAGPAGLAAAIRAKQRAEALGQELNVRNEETISKSFKVFQSLRA